MPTISFSGLSSGLDIAGIVDSLIAVERRPIIALQNKQVAADSEVSAWQDVNSKVLAFETAAGKINSSSEFQAIGGSFSNKNSNQTETAVTVTANANVAIGSYDIIVGKVAKQQKMISDQAFTDINKDTNITNIALTTGGKNYSIAGSSLGNMKDQINNLSIGVTATIINAGNSSSPSYRLQLASTATGTANSFTATVSDPGSFGGAVNRLSFTATQVAEDAAISLDGITIVGSTNSFSSVIEGVTIDVAAAGSGTISFTSSPDAIVSNVTDFTTAYNNVLDVIDQYDFYDQTTSETGVLFGNSSLRGIEEDLRSIITSIVGSNLSSTTEFSSLSQVGIKTDTKNRLSVNDADLRNSISENAKSVTSLFTTTGSASSGVFSFVKAGGGTVSGGYDVRYNGSTVQARLDGSSIWQDLTQFGNFWTGQAGSDTEGLMLRANTSDLYNGVSGRLDITIGIAEQIRYKTSYVTEFSDQGTIFNANKSLEDYITNLSDSIKSIEDRVALKKVTISRRFTNLEVALSQMKNEGNYLSSQLASLAK